MNVMRGSLQKEQTDPNISEEMQQKKRNRHENDPELGCERRKSRHTHTHTEERHTPVTAERFI